MIYTNQRSRSKAGTARRGVALMMVLSVVAAASILSWAMLSASSVRARVDSNASDAAEASALAASGASYAMHNLRFPERVRPSGSDGTWFYPGETGLKLWSDARGTVDITVTQTDLDTYKIRSTASVPRADSPSDVAKYTIETTVFVQLQGIVIAAGFNGPKFDLLDDQHIVGTTLSSGPLGKASNVSGSAAVVPANADVVPDSTKVQLLLETANAPTLAGSLATDRTYTFGGSTYAAEKAPATITSSGLQSQHPALNPYNVWYSSTNVLLNNATFTGVLVMRDNAVLSVSGGCNIAAPAGMPCLVVNKTIDIKGGPVGTAVLNVNGAVWIGDGFTASPPDKKSNYVKISGALLKGGTTTKFDVKATMDFNYKASTVSSVKHLSTYPTIVGLQVLSWKSTD